MKRTLLSISLFATSVAWTGTQVDVAYGQATTTTASQEKKGEKALTAEQEKRAKGMLKQSMKAYEDASLTSEQQTKAEELLKKAIKEVILLRDEAKLTPELLQKQTEAIKAAREQGIKGKKQAESAFAKAGFTEEQIKVFKDTQELLNNSKREFAKLLKPEQVAKLPEQMQKMLQTTK